MSRLVNKLIPILSGVSVNIQPTLVEVKGAKKTIQFPTHPNIKILTEDNMLKVTVDTSDVKLNKTKFRKLQQQLNCLSGTVWAHLNNAMIGVTENFKLKLVLVGVGYRAQLQGTKLSLTLGLSHPVIYELPHGVTAEVPSQTEIVLSSHDPQLVGEAAAKLRAYRLPECYKGKGIRFHDEVIKLKETKKK